MLEGSMSDQGSPAATATGWDRLGVIASSACAVHCTLLPLLAAAAPILGLAALFDGRVEWTLVMTTALVGLVGHGRAYRRNHRHVAPGLIFVLGFSLVLLGRLAVQPSWLEPFALGLGGALVAASHYANLRLCRCCSTCGADEG
jgi:hypothetical protein